MEKDIHKGHRQRLKERFLQYGLDAFNDINALELLLFYCIPKMDTNELAHELLARFGSFSCVLDASERDLKEIKGIGDHTITFFKLVRQLSNYYQVSLTKSTTILSSLSQCGEYLKQRLKDRTKETVFLLCMDAKCKVLCCEKVGEGSVNSASVPIRKIVDMALKVDASTVVLAHNHPSGIAIPSDDDIQTTKILAKTLRGVDILLADHVVVADDDYVSMFESKVYRYDDIYNEF